MTKWTGKPHSWILLKQKFIKTWIRRSNRLRRFETEGLEVYKVETGRSEARCNAAVVSNRLEVVSPSPPEVSS